MPLGESMISSLKSNKSIKLDKSSRFKKTLGGYGKNKKPIYDFPEATPEILAAIKFKIEKEQKAARIKAVILLAIIALTTLVLMF